jgi:hypothetical protein
MNEERRGIEDGAVAKAIDVKYGRVKWICYTEIDAAVRANLELIDAI